MRKKILWMLCSFFLVAGCGGDPESASNTLVTPTPTPASTATPNPTLISFAVDNNEIPSAVGQQLNSLWIDPWLGVYPGTDCSAANQTNRFLYNVNYYYGSAGQSDTGWNPGVIQLSIGGTLHGKCVRLESADDSYVTNWIYVN